MFICNKAKGFGVNLNVFAKGKSTTISRNDLGIDEGDRVLIYVGRLVAFKGFNLVLEALRELNSREGGKYKLIVCGDFDKVHKIKFNESEKEMWSYSKNIVKAGFAKDVRPYLANSDLNRFPSRRESLPVNIMESIAMGVPTLTSNSKGCRHAVIPLVNGIFVEDYIVESWVSAIVGCFDNEELFNQLRDGCRKSRFLYDRSLYTLELSHLYSELIK